MRAMKEAKDEAAKAKMPRLDDVNNPLVDGLVDGDVLRQFLNMSPVKNGLAFYPSPAKSATVLPGCSSTPQDSGVDSSLDNSAVPPLPRDMFLAPTIDARDFNAVNYGMNPVILRKLYIFVHIHQNDFTAQLAKSSVDEIHSEMGIFYVYM